MLSVRRMKPYWKMIDRPHVFFPHIKCEGFVLCVGDEPIEFSTSLPSNYQTGAGNQRANRHTTNPSSEPSTSSIPSLSK